MKGTYLLAVFSLLFSLVTNPVTFVEGAKKSASVKDKNGNNLKKNVPYHMISGDGRGVKLSWDGHLVLDDEGSKGLPFSFLHRNKDKKEGSTDEIYENVNITVMIGDRIVVPYGTPNMWDLKGVEETSVQVDAKDAFRIQKQQVAGKKKINSQVYDYCLALVGDVTQRVMKDKYGYLGQHGAFAAYFKFEPKK